MMKTKVFKFFLAVLWVLSNSIGVGAQSRFIKVNFEVDGKPIEQRFKVVFYIKGEATEPLRFENGFVVPPELEKYDQVGVRFIFGKHDLFFEPISTSKFSVPSWIIGIDNKPFDQEYVEPEIAKKLRVIHYITFVPDDADETRFVVRVYKRGQKGHTSS